MLVSITVRQRRGIGLPERPRLGHEPLVDEPHPARCVVDQHVDPAIDGQRPFHEAVHVHVNRDVGLYGLHASRQRRALGRHRLGLRGIARRADHDVGAGSRIGERDRAPDPATATGHDRHPVASRSRRRPLSYTGRNARRRRSMPAVRRLHLLGTPPTQPVERGALGAVLGTAGPARSQDQRSEPP